MNFSDIFRKSFLQAINTGDINIVYVILLLGIACIFSGYIFFIYRILTRKSFYNKDFNVSLAVLIVIVAAIVITIQSSLVVSLGMVGALSIVRFRTAVKNAIDLVFLFWAIAIGIIVGAGLPGIALIMTAIITVGMFILELIPTVKPSKLLIININDKEKRNEIVDIVSKNTSFYKIASEIIEDNKIDMIIEFRSRDAFALLNEMSNIQSISKCSVLDHNGETVF